jgi:hypothetical protein
MITKNNCSEEIPLYFPENFFSALEIAALAVISALRHYKYGPGMADIIVRFQHYGCPYHQHQLIRPVWK